MILIRALVIWPVVFAAPWMTAMVTATILWPSQGCGAVSAVARAHTPTPEAAS